MVERYQCSVASLAADEPGYGTASQIRRWILVEQPGTWGVDAVTSSGLPADVGTRLRAIATAMRARLLLIRRFGRSAPVRRTCFVAVTTPAIRRVERFVVDTPDDLLAIDWTPLGFDEVLGGEILDDPLYLVCTNGRHDPCCAEFGRPVARALDPVLGDRVWESSHFGGDRFAGNLVCLPDGLYYGRVTPENGLRLVELHASGHLDLDHYRGRSCFSFVAQAAEHLVREQTGVTAIDALTPVRVEQRPDGLFGVHLEGPDDTVLQAVVECAPSIDSQQLTCRSTRSEHPPRYRLVEVA